MDLCCIEISEDSTATCSRRSPRIQAGKTSPQEQDRKQETSDRNRSENQDEVGKEKARKRKSAEARSEQGREGRAAADAISKKSKSTAKEQDEDTVPRDARRRQQNLPRDIVLESQPADRGTSAKEKPDNAEVVTKYTHQ